MKKGLTIALLMVAMVALAASASAVAPVIQDLPSVIIGDAGDVAGAGTTALHLLRYDNVFDLSQQDVIEKKNNPTTSTNLAVYYTVPSPSTNTLKASNATTKIQPLTAAEITALTVSGTAPASAKKINTSTSYWLSLIHDAGATPVVNCKDSTPTLQGATIASLTAKSSLDPTVVTLYAYEVPVLTSANLVDSNSFVVYSVIDSVDKLSPAVVVKDIQNLSSATEFTYLDEAGAQTGTNANLQSIPGLTTTLGKGFTGVATFNSGKSQGYSSWANAGGPYVAAAGMSNKVFCATMKMTGNSTAANKLQTPAYRVLFYSISFVHGGGFVVATKGGTNDTGSAPNYPYEGNDVTARMYWAVPSATNQYADGEKVATFIPGADQRDYLFMFDIMQGEAGDVGTIVMESLQVEKKARPMGVTPAIKWGGTDGLAFNAAASPWSAAGAVPSAGWVAGVGAVSATGVTMNMAASASSVFVQANPAVNATLPAWTSNKLIRVSYNLSASSISGCPQIRMLAQAWVMPINFQFGNVTWGEALDPTLFRANPAWPTGFGLGGSPKVAGSQIDTYLYTMTAPSLPAEACVIAPLMDIDQPPGTTFPVSGYTADAVITVNKASMEILNVPN